MKASALTGRCSCEARAEREEAVLSQERSERAEHRIDSGEPAFDALGERGLAGENPVAREEHARACGELLGRRGLLFEPRFSQEPTAFARHASRASSEDDPNGVERVVRDL